MAELTKTVVTFIGKNPIKLFIAGVLILNSFGFCYEKMWFLSDEERIELGVQKALNFYDGSESWGETDFIIDNESAFNSKDRQQIPYLNKEDFFLKNPNCCEVRRATSVSEGIIRVNAFGCLLGVSPYIVSGKFAVQFKENGKVKTSYSKFSYFISSCGKLYYLFD